MTTRVENAVRRMHLGLLWGASLLVPSSERSEWSRQWRTELWYVLRECFSAMNPDRKSVRKTTAFCMGAYQDAIWLRHRSWQEQQPLAQICRSPSVCLLLLSGICLSAWAVARISPNVAAGMSRIEVYPRQVSDNRAEPCDCAFDATNEIRSLPTARLWFDGFSHYQVAQEAVWGEAMPRTKWKVAHARSDFFTVLRLPISLMGDVRSAHDKSPQIVLSRETWTREFASNPNIAGTKLNVGSVDAIVAGVAFSGSSGLPGRANAWLLGSDLPMASDSAEFLVAHLSPTGYWDDGRWAPSMLGILLAFLMLPFVNHASLADYTSHSRKPPWARRSLFWTFLIAKISAIVAIVYFASIDLDCLFIQPFSHFSGNIQAASAVVLCLLGLNWAFRDQQQRCPYCLRPMAHPVQIGQPSRTFLDWNGTELVCERGHTLLHIPEIPTSWFRCQQWVCLDRSWQFLFVRPSGR
jgi:hypothetical protein